MILRARIVLPISRPPIEDGVILISGNRIAAVGRWRDVSTGGDHEVVNLGDVVLLPGLINAHCHLDYTDMVGQFLPPRSFVDWIKLITTAKASWGYSEFAQSWLRGAQMLLRSGTTTVADIEAVPELLPDVWQSTPLRVLSFLEMTGVRSRRAPEAILRDAIEIIESLPAGRCQAGFSPHAPYSTTPDLMKATAIAARRHRRLVSTHVAESAVEFDMFMHGYGEMFAWLRRNNRDMSDCGDLSPVQHLEKAGLLNDNLLAVHANYLADGDAQLLARNGVNVVHCPRSRDYFDHSEFPYVALSKAGVNICLGTDSLASMETKRKQPPSLDLFAEMRAFATINPDVPAVEILNMVTANGARALGMVGQVGELSEGALADMITIPFTGKVVDVWQTILHHADDVAASMIDGQWTIKPAAH